MGTYKMKYGKGEEIFEFPDENILKIIEQNKEEKIESSAEEIVRAALDNPIGTAKLREIVKKGESVAVLIPDITRAWQSPEIFVPLVIEELNKGGILDKDIIIIVALGTHRMQTEDEMKRLVSADIYNRISVVNHDCKDEENLVYCGTTSRGTVVRLNKKAMSCNHMVLLGGIVYHFLAGFGGGRKTILPGISSYDTVMQNHAYSFNKGLGSGTNPYIKCGSFDENNPIHSDMIEAANFAKPTFMLNVIVDAKNKISNAFAGDFIKAHVAGVNKVIEIDGIVIDEKADMVIASACGFPKDMNLYQSSKTMFNAIEALKDNGVLIIISDCTEGFGSSDTEYILTKFDNMFDREKDVRKIYSIGKGIGYAICETSEKFNYILVTKMKPELFEKTKIIAVESIGAALEIAYKIKETKNLKTYLMPVGANTKATIR